MPLPCVCQNTPPLPSVAVATFAFFTSGIEEFDKAYREGYLTKVIATNLTYRRPEAVYACLNRGEAAAPDEIKNKSICLNGDIGEILEDL